MPKLSRSAPKSKKQAVMGKVMHKFKHGTQRSGSKKRKHRPVVTDPKQAIAIGLSESGQSKKQFKGKGKRVGRK